MRRSGPDSFSSWIIAAACCFINMMMYGMARLSGVLFVASVPRFHVTREQASFPFTFANFIRNTAGPLVGYLGDKIGVRPVTTFGCLVSAIGVGASFLAEDINIVTVSWGFVFGIGFGLGNILLPVKINQYFDKHRATASGISFSGACLGSFILPLVVEKLLEIYGLSGTFLILSGLVLNCVPAALLLGKPNFSTKPPSKTDSESQVILKKVKLYTVEQDEASKKVPSTFTSLTYEERIKRLSTQTLLSTYSVRMSTPDALVDVEQILENSKGRRQVDQDAVDCEVSSLASSTTDSVFGQVLDDKCMPGIVFDCGLGKDNVAFQYSKSMSDLYVNSALHQNGKENKEEGVACKNSRSNAFSVIFDPLFVLLAITNAIYCFTFVCIFTVIVDFARDINIPYSHEKYILMSISVGDFLGRIGLGWVTDKGYMTKTAFAAACFLGQGVTTAAIAWCSGFMMLITLSFLYGLSEAGLIVIYPLIMAEYIDEDKQTVAISSSNFFAGPLCLSIAPLIGFFRDKVGSYEFIFLGIGGLSIFCCLAFLLTPLITRNRKSAK